MEREDLRDDIEDSLLNAEVRIGGRIGLASEEAQRHMFILGLIGAAGGLTRRGATRARQLQLERWGGQG